MQCFHQIHLQTVKKNSRLKALKSTKNSPKHCKLESNCNSLAQSWSFHYQDRHRQFREPTVDLRFEWSHSYKLLSTFDGQSSDCLTVFRNCRHYMIALNIYWKKLNIKRVLLNFIQTYSVMKSNWMSFLTPDVLA